MQYAQPPYHVFPFRWIFPVGQLVLCLLLVSIVVPLRGYVPYRYADHVFEAITAIDLPGGLILLPTAIFSADHVIGRPPWLSLLVWRSITWPVSAMVFWWIAGR